MTLPVSGLISMGQVNTELTLSPTALIGLNDAPVRALAVKPSGLIGMGDLHGKSAAFIFNQTISSNVQNYNLRAAAVSAGWNQSIALKATITINPGVVVGSSSIGSYAFDTGNTFPAGTSLALVNNGYIVGMGGAAGNAGPIVYASFTGSTGLPGSSGGPALRVQQGISITNNGVIGGGGGGGGGGGTVTYQYYPVASKYIAANTGNFAEGGGGGGGAGNTGGAFGLFPPCTAGKLNVLYNPSNGAAGTATAGGAGGQYGLTIVGGSFEYDGGAGGAGGALGSPGASGGYAWNASYGIAGYGTVYAYGGAGGAAGAAVAGNSNITWVIAGSRLGAIA